MTRDCNTADLCTAIAITCCFAFVFGFCVLGLEIAFGQIGLVGIFSALIMVISPIVGVVSAILGKYYEKKGR